MRTNFRMQSHQTWLDRRYWLIALMGILLISFGLFGTKSRAFAQVAPFPLPEEVTLSVQSHRVVLDWVYTVDPTSVTYTLERSETSSRAEAIIVPASVLSSTGDGEPVVAYYSMSDMTVQPGRPYTYWLTVTNRQGEATTLGPFTTGQVDDASEQQHQLFLPIVATAS